MRNHLSFPTALFAAGLFSATFTLNTFAAQLTDETAKITALENSGVKEENVVLVSVEKDFEDGQLVYEVAFFTKTAEEYNYELLAEDGKILGISYEKKGVSTAGSVAKEVTLEQAQEIALSYAGVKADQATWIKQNTELDDGEIMYELEFYTSDYQKYDYDIVKKNGEILSWEYELESDYARMNAGNQTHKTASAKAAAGGDGEISLQEAKTTVLKMAGLENTDVSWGRVYKKYDDGRRIYKGKFFSHSLEYEFELDAVSGAILDWEAESIFD